MIRKLKNEAAWRVRRVARAAVPDPLVHRFRVRKFEKLQTVDVSVYDRFADTTKHALDIGANHGTITRLLADRFRRVHAFEPDPVNLAQLRAHAPGNVSVHGLALSDEHGTAEMRTPVWGGAPSRGHGSLVKSFDGHDSVVTVVRTVPLDSLQLSELAFVKIDVEGFELAVIRGARETLRREQPPVWIEIEAIHGGVDHINAVFSELESLGYRGRFYWKGQWLSLDRFEHRTHQPKDGATRRPGEFVSDFLFEAAPTVA